MKLMQAALLLSALFKPPIMKVVSDSESEQ